MIANDIKFRCSQLGEIMTEPKTKSETISETAKQACINSFLKYRYGREKDIENKYISKGLQVEEDSITLYSRLKKTFFKKNETRIENDFISGTPDTFSGESIMTATEIIDIKSSWDLFTFYKSKFSKTDKGYFYQLQGYMWLTGAKVAKLVYCLIDTPEALINDAKRRFMWKAMIGDENEITAEYFPILEKNMTFQDVPLEERMFEIIIPLNEPVLISIQDRVIECRYWIEKNLL